MNKTCLICFLVLFLIFGSSGCKESEAAKAKFTLSVTISEGITANLTNGSHSYSEGDQVKFEFTLKDGYTNLQVTLDGQIVGNTGTITMNTTHTLIATIIFAQGDLKGRWKGTAKNSSNTYNLDLSINSSGSVSGKAIGKIDGVQQTKTFLPEYTVWNPSAEGEIAFDNQTWFVMINQFQGVLYKASWKLQMSFKKDELTGTLNINRNTLTNMTVSLKKSL